MVYLATDPDREGEAISWHLSKALKLEPEKMRRITFNEITKTAVKDSLKHARDIDMDLVDAQQARRVIDRLVGYEISPILWKKIKRGLVRRPCAVGRAADHRRPGGEINAFIPQEYWTPRRGLFMVDRTEKTADRPFLRNGQKERWSCTPRAEVEEVISVTSRESEIFGRGDPARNARTKKAPLPFTTSTLQQEASNVAEHVNVQDDADRAAALRGN
jgi:DNA topoisomerase-1